MAQVLGNLSQFFSRVPDILRARRRLALSFFVLATLLLVWASATQFSVNMNPERFFSDEDPVKVALNELRAEFGSDDLLFVVYRAQDNDVFSAASLGAIYDLHQELTQYTGASSREVEGDPAAIQLGKITRVFSIANMPVTEMRNGVAGINPFIVDGAVPTSSEARREAIERAHSDPASPMVYFSEDHQYGAIYVTADFKQGIAAPAADEATPITDYVAFMRVVESILEKPQYTDRFEFYSAGVPATNAYQYDALAQMGPLFLLMLLLTFLLLWVMFHSLSAVVWPVVVVVLSTLWMIGLASLAGVSFNSMMVLTLLMLFAVGIADAVHIMSGYFYHRNNGKEHRPALDLAMKKSSVACLLTTVTTMMGMLVFALMPMAPMVSFGLTTALGILLAFLFTVFLLPLMLDFWHPSGSRNGDKQKTPAAGSTLPQPLIFVKKLLSVPFIPLRWLLYRARGNALLGRYLDSIPALVDRRRWAIVGLFFCALLVFVFGMFRVEVDSNTADLLRGENDIRAAFDIVDEYMGGPHHFDVLVDAGTPGAFADPRMLGVVNDIQQHLEEQYPEYVSSSRSLAVRVRLFNKVMHGGDEDYFVIPEDGQAVSELIAAFEREFGANARFHVSEDYDVARINFAMYNHGSEELTAFFEEIDGYMDEMLDSVRPFYPDVSVVATGGFPLQMKLMDYVSSAQLMSFALALGVISLLLILVFGSLRLGLVAIIPNLMPAFAAVGLLGLTGVPLDVNSLLLAAVIIGISVDDTVHFVHSYSYHLGTGESVEDAIAAAVKEVGQAVTFTTLALGAGFAILGMSTMTGISNVGIFGTTAVLIAWLNDIYFLPALLHITRPERMQPELIARSVGEAG